MALNAERIETNLDKLRKAFKKAHKRPSPEEVHHLRTRTRRTEVTLKTLALDSSRKERWLLRRLSRIRKLAGKVRDLDVFTSDLSSVRVDGERDCLIQLFEYLGCKRYKHASKLHTLIKKNAPLLRKRLKRISKDLETSVDRYHKKSGQNQVTAEVVASVQTLSSELAMPATLNRRNLHGYRLKIKELRYVLEMMDDAGQKQLLKVLREVRDAIGEWHDWEELIALANELLDHGPNCELVRELKAISARKFEAAVSKANKMRKDYFRPPERSVGRNLVHINQAAR